MSVLTQSSFHDRELCCRRASACLRRGAPPEKRNPIVFHSELYESRAICNMSVKLNVLEISFACLRSLIRHFVVVWQSMWLRNVMTVFISKSSDMKDTVLRIGWLIQVSGGRFTIGDVDVMILSPPLLSPPGLVWWRLLTGRSEESVDKYIASLYGHFLSMITMLSIRRENPLHRCVDASTPSGFESSAVSYGRAGIRESPTPFCR